MGVGSFFKKLAPWLSAGASFVPGAGPVIAATINNIAGTHGVTLAAPADASLPETLENAVAALTGNSAALGALKQADNDYALQMQAAGFKQVADLEALAVQDRESARNREIQVRDKTPEIGFYVLTIGFFTALFCLFHFPIPADNKSIIFTAMGALTTVWIASATYFYGTTRGSANKDQVLASIAKQP